MLIVLEAGMRLMFYVRDGARSADKFLDSELCVESHDVVHSQATNRRIVAER